MIRRLGSVAAAMALLVLCAPPPQASALTIPEVDPAALPPDGPPSPEQEMRQNGQCSFNGTAAGLKPGSAPLNEHWPF